MPNVIQLYVYFLVTVIGASAKGVPPQRSIQKRMNVCYGDLGCFNTNRPFWSIQRPINLLPQRPDSINTKFRLFTRTNLHQPQLINAKDYGSIRRSYFLKTRPTKIVSHGFLENGLVAWMQHMKDELLKNGDYNVILVDWGGGSSFPYTQATANTRLVGAEIARLIKVLQQQLGADPATMHIIGHSLGAHIAGYAGERTMNLGRITGLDPAGPYFENTDKTVRLDPTDAAFVDVIHTDGESLLPNLGFGIKMTVGHVDYFPNSGHDQPGCDKDPITSITVEGDLYEGGKQFIACNHLRSYAYFTESINTKCPFEGYYCSDYDHFKSGSCIPCAGGNCGAMGFHADRVKPARGATGKKYFLITGDTAPFCRYHYNVRLTIGRASNANSWSGDIFVNLHGTNGQMGEVKLNDDKEYLQAGHSYSYVVTAPHDLGTIQDVMLHWSHSSGLLNPLEWNPFNLRHPKVFFQKVDVVEGESNRHSTFCETSSVETDHALRLTRRC